MGAGTCRGLRPLWSKAAGRRPASTRTCAHGSSPGEGRLDAQLHGCADHPAGHIGETRTWHEPAERPLPALPTVGAHPPGRLRRLPDLGPSVARTGSPVSMSRTNTFAHRPPMMGGTARQHYSPGVEEGRKGPQATPSAPCRRVLGGGVSSTAARAGAPRQVWSPGVSGGRGRLGGRPDAQAWASRKRRPRRGGSVPGGTFTSRIEVS